MRNWKIYLGPPGTGKTTTLLNEVEAAVKVDKDLRKIAYVSFTKQAVNEAVSRVRQAKEELPYFKTIHALGFRLSGLSTSGVMQKEHYKEIGEKLGLELSGSLNRRYGAEELGDGDKALTVIEQARAKCIPAYQAWEESDLDLDLDWLLVDLLQRTLEKYKRANLLVDYAGMLETYLEKGAVPALNTFIIDEAQDLSPLQWRVIEKLTSNCRTIIAAGDDDQAIYKWAGAIPEELITRVENTTPIVLSKSYRLPQEVHAYSFQIINRVKNRAKKQFAPRDAKGGVDFRASLEDIDMAKGDWLLLYRNRYLTRDAVEHCRREGFYYDCFLEPAKGSEALRAAFIWEDLRKGLAVTGENIALVKSFISDKKLTAINKPWYEALDLLPVDEVEYIRAMRKSGEMLTKKPRIRIDTIHGVKGAEAENVVISPDMSYKTFQGMEQNEDDECRVFYVGATRAKENLFLLKPTTNCSFNLEGI